MSPDSTLRILGNAAFSGGGVGSLTLTNGFTNEGRIELDSIGSGQSLRDAVLIVTSGTLTNAPGGVIRTLPGIGGSRRLEAQIDNQGLIDADTDTSIVNTGRTFTSSGGTLRADFDRTLTIDRGTSVLGAGTLLSGEGVVDLAGIQTLDLPSDLVLPGTGAPIVPGRHGHREWTWVTDQPPVALEAGRRHLPCRARQ